MFWQYQALYDVLYSATALSWAVVLLLLHLIPGLIGVIADGWRYRRSEAVSIYIARFVPYWLFSGLIDMSRSLLLTLIVLSYLIDDGWLPRELHASQALRLLVYGLGVVWLFNFSRRIGYRYWAYLVMSREASQRLKQDYLSLSLLATIVLMPLSVLSLVSGLGTWVMGLTIIAIGLTLLARFVFTIIRLLPAGGSYVGVFLYLCTHEWLPWCLVALAGSYWALG